MEKWRKIVITILLFPFLLGIGLFVGLLFWLSFGISVALPAIIIIWLISRERRLHAPTPATPAAPATPSGGWKSWTAIIVILAVLGIAGYLLFFTPYGESAITWVEVQTLKTPKEMSYGQVGNVTTYTLPPGVEVSYPLIKHSLTVGQVLIVTTQAITKDKTGVVYSASGNPILGGSRQISSANLLSGTPTGTVIGSIQPVVGIQSTEYFVIGDGVEIEILSDRIVVNGKDIIVKGGTANSFLYLGVNYPKEASLTGKILVNVRYVDRINK